MNRSKSMLLGAIFCICTNVHAQQSVWTGGGEAIIGFGINLNFATVDKPALGGFLNAEYFLSSFFSAGVRGGFSYSGVFGGSEEALTNLDMLFLGRIYFPRFKWDFVSMFVEAEAGLLLMNKSTGNGGSDSRGTAQIGVAAGGRFFLPRDFFADIYLRGGWPFIFELGLGFGYRFNAKNPPKQENATLQKAESDAAAAALATAEPETTAFSATEFETPETIESELITSEFATAEPPKAEGSIDSKPIVSSRNNQSYIGSFKSLGEVFKIYENSLDLTGAKKHRVKRGETLNVISTRYYGKSYYYPLIMLVSGLNDDSQPLEDGRILVIPNEKSNFKTPKCRAAVSDMFDDLSRFYKSQGNQPMSARMRTSSNFWR